MTWTSHTQRAGGRVVWLDGDDDDRSITADVEGVHPRLDQRDHAEGTRLPSSHELEHYLDERDPQDPDAIVLIAASLLSHQLRLEAHHPAAPAA